MKEIRRTLVLPILLAACSPKADWGDDEMRPKYKNQVECKKDFLPYECEQIQNEYYGPVRSYSAVPIYASGFVNREGYSAPISSFSSRESFRSFSKSNVGATSRSSSITRGGFGSTAHSSSFHSSGS